MKETNDLLSTADCSVLILLDLSAAFDTVDHTILIDCLKHWVGIFGSVLSLLRSYRSDRTYFVKTNDSSATSRQ